MTQPKVRPSAQLDSEKIFLLWEIVPKLRFPITSKSLNRYCLHGSVNRFTRERVFLECTRLPRGYATSTEAVERFLWALNKMPAKDQPARPKKVTPPKPKKKSTRCKKKS